MITTSETVVTAAIWALTAIGCFFGVRAALRSRKATSDDKKKVCRQADGMLAFGTLRRQQLQKE